MPDKHTEGDYASLSYKYNRLLSAHNALRQEHNDGEAAWKKIEKKYKDEIAAMRRFLERILAKSPAEISASHGKEYSWSSLPTMELLAKAIAAYDLHNKTRTELMRSIQAIAEQRSQMIEDITTQYEALKAELGEGRSHAMPEKKVSKETMARVNYTLQKAVEEGGAKVEVVQEEEDASLEDIKQLAEMQAAGNVLDAKEQNISITPSQFLRQKAQNLAANATSVILLSADDIRKEMDENHWAILSLIGNFGLDNIQDIAAKTKELTEKGEKIVAGTTEYDPAFKDTTLRNTLKALVKLQLLSEEKLSLPMGNKNLYRLTDKGVVFYMESSGGVAPVKSQYDLVVANHDNAEHGYGILALAKALEDSGFYSSVSTDREKNTIKQKDRAYIPDIIAIRKEKTRRGNKMYNYFEYERNTHHLNDFLIKLNKMALATRHIYLIAPNMEVVKGLKAKVDKWIESRRTSAQTMDHTVYIASLKAFVNAGADVKNEKAWAHVISLSEEGNRFLPKEMRGSAPAQSDVAVSKQKNVPKKEGVQFTTDEIFDYL